MSSRGKAPLFGLRYTGEKCLLQYDPELPSGRMCLGKGDHTKGRRKGSKTSGFAIGRYRCFLQVDASLSAALGPPGFEYDSAGAVRAFFFTSCRCNLCMISFGQSKAEPILFSNTTRTANASSMCRLSRQICLLFPDYRVKYVVHAQKQLHQP